jgi:Bardet-Biedl syndrome 9 protein
VYEQDCLAFSRFLPNFLLPGPLCYVGKIDAFVTCNSQMDVECYRYQTLASSSGGQKKDGASQDAGITAAKRLQVCSVILCSVTN